MHNAAFCTGKEVCGGHAAAASGTDGNGGTIGRAALDASDSSGDIPGTGGAAIDGVPRAA